MQIETILSNDVIRTILKRQKEVHKTYIVLSVLMQAYGMAEYCQINTLMNR